MDFNQSVSNLSNIAAFCYGPLDYAQIFSIPISNPAYSLLNILEIMEKAWSKTFSQVLHMQV